MKIRNVPSAGQLVAQWVVVGEKQCRLSGADPQPFVSDTRWREHIHKLLGLVLRLVHRTTKHAWYPKPMNPGMCLLAGVECRLLLGLRISEVEPEYTFEHNQST